MTPVLHPSHLLLGDHISLSVTCLWEGRAPSATPHHSLPFCRCGRIGWAHCHLTCPSFLAGHGMGVGCFSYDSIPSSTFTCCRYVGGKSRRRVALSSALPYTTYLPRIASSIRALVPATTTMPCNLLWRLLPLRYRAV